MRILVTGSRTWTDEDAIHTVLDEFARTAFRLGDTEVTVVHGSAKGADMIADRWAQRWSQHGPISAERHPADWAKYGRRAGFVRNSHMVTLGADVCVAFIGPCESTRCGKSEPHGSHGATGCAALAESGDIRTERFVLPEVER